MAQAPPGELLAVAAAVRQVLDGDEAAFAEAAGDAFEAYNEAQMATARAPDTGAKLLLARVGRLGSNVYLNPSTGAAVTVDPFALTIKASRPALKRQLPHEGVELCRAAVEEALSPYMRETYPDGLAAVYGASLDQLEAEPEAAALTVCISSAYLRPKHFINGRWTSRWHVVINPGEDEATGMRAHIFGDVKVGVHYFEECNIQLSSNYSGSMDVAGEDLKALSVAIVTAIAGAEGLYLKELEECYADLSNHTIKDMRRKLPKTGQKFPWSAQALRLKGELKHAKAQAPDAEQ